MAPDRIELPLIDEEADDPEPPIEPGEPSPENALFVLLGVLIALAVVVRMFLLFG